MTDADLTVYLAGPVRGPFADWRRAFDAELFSTPAQGMIRTIHPGANLTIPVDTDPEAMTHLYIAGDLLSIDRCDVIVARATEEHPGRGTAVEIGYALHARKQVLLWCPTDRDRYAWRFAAGMIGHVYTEQGEIVQLLRYMCAQVAGYGRYDPGQPG